MKFTHRDHCRNLLYKTCQFFTCWHKLKLKKKSSENLKTKLPHKRSDQVELLQCNHGGKVAAIAITSSEHVLEFHGSVTQLLVIDLVQN